MKTPAQIARTWGNFVASWAHDFEARRSRYTYRDVGPYRVVLENGVVIGHTLSEVTP